MGEKWWERRGCTERAGQHIATASLIRFIKLSKDQDISLLLTATLDHEEAQGMDAEAPLVVVTEAVLWLKLLKPSQT